MIRPPDHPVRTVRAYSWISPQPPLRRFRRQRAQSPRALVRL